MNICFKLKVKFFFIVLNTFKFLMFDMVNWYNEKREKIERVPP